MKPLIVGVDPGSTSAVAMVDFNSDVVGLESGKNFPPREIISKIIETGKPVIVTSDKAKIPSKVEKIANSVGAKKFIPEEDLSSERKRELGSGENSHEEDAVAAALHAYKQLRSNIDKIEELSGEMEMDMEKSEIASRYFSDELPTPGSEEETQEAEKKEEKTEENIQGEQKQDSDPDPELYRRRAEKLETKVRNLEEQVEDLKNRLEFREQQRRNIQSKYDKLKDGKKEEMLKEQEISKREGIINDKEEKIEELEEKFQRSRIREKQYEKALELIAEGGQLLPIIDENFEESPDASVTRSEELRDELRSQGEKIFHVDEVEGVELLEKFVVDGEELDEDPDDIIEKYRNSR